MPVFTFIANFQGGTYTDQKEAETLKPALLSWKETVIDEKYVQNLNFNDFSGTFDEWVEEIPPHPLNGLINTWRFDLLINDDLLEVYIVQTDPDNVG
jgi:hypothetical protein